MMKFFTLKQKFNLVIVTISLLLSFVSIKHAAAQTETLPPFFTDQLVSSNWNQAEGFVFDANKRRYVWEKCGYIWIVDTNNVKQSTPLLDIHDEVGCWGDHGMNGFALDPEFLINGYFYCFYTVDRHYLLNYGTPNYSVTKNEYSNATITRLVRFQADANTNFTTLIPNSRTVLIGDKKTNGIPVLHTSHSGGSVVFGRDGSLLVSTGDGANFNGVDTGSASVSYWYQGILDSIITPQANVGSYRSQMMDNYNGKVLRIDPSTGLGLPTNPFYDPLHPESVRSKVWCLGLRHPYRMSITPGTGNTDISAGDPGVLMIGEVGWFTYEELNVSKHGGENFGWPIFEGLNMQAGYSNYQKVNQDAPNPLFDSTNCTQQYFNFKDLLKQATLDTTVKFLNPCDTTQEITTYPTFFQTRPQIEWRHTIVSTRTGTFNGTTASVINTDDPSSPVKGAQFAGNASLAGTWYMDNRMPVEYQGKYFHNDYGSQWFKMVTFDNNFNATAIDSFVNNQGKPVFLAVNPIDGCFNYVKYVENEIRKICYTAFVNNPPVPVISVNKKYGVSPLKVTFNGSGSYDTETKVNLSYLWKFGDGFTSTGKIAAHTYNVAGLVPTKFWASLKVTDSLGLSKTDSILICVNNTPPVVNITSINDSDFYSITQQTLVNLQASVTDAEHADSLLKYAWQVIVYHNNHTHPGPIDSDKVTDAIIDPVGCDGEVFWYAITLKVSDPLGLVGYDTVTIFPACGPPTANFTNSNQIVCPGGAVQFKDSSTFASNWLWTFPGGTPSTSTLKSPYVSYSNPGLYDVKLIVLNPEGADTIIKHGIINVGGDSVFITSASDSLCGNLAITLTANSPAGTFFKWYFNGNLIPAATAFTYPANAVGTCTVVATKSNGCISTASKTLYQKQVISTISSNKSPLLCFADTLTLSVDNPGAYSYQWKKGTANIAGATGPSYKTGAAGAFSVVTSNNGCTSKSNAVTVTIEPIFSSVASGPLTFCGGDSVKFDITNPAAAYTYQWQLNGLDIPNATQTSYTAKNSGLYSANVIAASGCIRKSTVYKVIVDTGFTKVTSTTDSLCGTSPITLTASAPTGSTYKWYFNNVLINTATTKTYAANNSGTYMVEAKKTNGCVSAATKTMKQKQIIPSISANKAPLICYLDTITLSVDTPQTCSYQWKNGNVVLNGATGITYQTVNLGYYKVTTNNNGCEGNSNAINVTIEPSFSAIASGSLTICTGDSVTLSIINPGGPYTYQWLNKGIEIVGETASTYVAKTAGNYQAKVTTASGCIRKSSTFKVLINCKLDDNDINPFIENLSVQPNPVTDLLNVSFDLIKSEDIIVSIFDVTGRAVYKSTYQNIDGGENLLNIDASNFNEGIYEIRLTSSSNTQLKAQSKFIKSK